MICMLCLNDTYKNFGKFFIVLCKGIKVFDFEKLAPLAADSSDSFSMKIEI